MQIALARRLFSLPRAVLSCCAARCAVMLCRALCRHARRGIKFRWKKT